MSCGIYAKHVATSTMHDCILVFVRNAERRLSMLNKTYHEIIEVRDRLQTGARRKIAAKCKVSEAFVSRVLNDNADNMNRWNVERVFTECEKYKGRRPDYPVKRTDLLNKLPHGTQTQIAAELNLSHAIVWQTLHGLRTQTDRTGRKIVELAEAEVKKLKTRNS